MKILSLEAQNILRLKAVRIQPDGNVVIIGGENKQGKTSILESIRMACGGARALPAEPIHRGAKEGNVRLDLGDLTVEFVVDKKGGSVVVRNADGVKQAKPQAILDRLFAKVAFDPESFARAEPKKQVEILKALLGLDFSALDAERAKLYEQRTRVGSVRSDAEVRVSQYHASCVTAPDAEVSIAALLEDKRIADKHNAERSRLESAHTQAIVEVDRLALALDEARAKLDTAERALYVAPAKVSTEATEASLASAEDTNILVRNKKARAEAVAKFTEKDREYATLTKQIEAIDENKREQLAAAKWPVPGLGFGDEGVTYNGLPFEQASQAEARIVSFSIGAALNPDLRVVLIDDGEKLDKASMKHLAQLAADKDMQVWIERVGDGDAGAVIIEDGEVKPTLSDEV
jgi:hypothetical protein